MIHLHDIPSSELSDEMWACAYWQWINVGKYLGNTPTSVSKLQGYWDKWVPSDRKYVLDTWVRDGSPKHEKYIKR